MRTADANDIDENEKLPQANKFILKDDEIKKLLINHKGDNPSLDICNRNLKVLPSELFVLAHLQVSYTSTCFFYYNFNLNLQGNLKNSCHKFFVISKSYQALQAVCHRFNIYASSFVTLVL